MMLYRAVSPDEYKDILDSGKLRAGPSSCEGKHLAYSLQDAWRWGQAFYGEGQFLVIEVDLPDEVAATLHRWDRLDGIGPACFATIKQLEKAGIGKVSR